MSFGLSLCLLVFMGFFQLVHQAIGPRTVEEPARRLESTPAPKTSPTEGGPGDELSFHTMQTLAIYDATEISATTRRELLVHASQKANSMRRRHDAHARLMKEHAWSLLVDRTQSRSMRHAAAQHALESAPGRAAMEAQLMSTLGEKAAAGIDTSTVYLTLRARGFEPRDEWLAHLVFGASVALRVTIRDDIREQPPEAWTLTLVALDRFGVDVTTQMDELRRIARAGALSVASERPAGALSETDEPGGLALHER